MLVNRHYSGSLRLLVHPVGPSEGAEIIEPHPILLQHPMSSLGGHLPYVEGVADHKRGFLRLAGAFTVGAARPARGAAFAGGEIFLGTGNATPSGVGFLGVFYPADPLVARQWGDVLPLGEHGWIGLQGLPQVVGQGVDDATADGAVFHDGLLPVAATVTRFAGCGWFYVYIFSDVGIIVQMML